MSRAPLSALLAAAPRSSGGLLRGALAALALLAAGCSDPFDPASLIQDRRILALVAEPPELDGTTPGATTTVRAVLAAPLVAPPLPDQTDTLEPRWSFCPFTLGAAAGYACAVPQCEVGLTPDASGAVALEPLALAAACLQDPRVVLPPELAGGALPPTVEVLVRYRLVAFAAAPLPSATAVVVREAVQRIPVWTTAPGRPRNAQPAFAAAAVTVVSPAGATLAEPCADPTSTGVAGCPSAGTLTRAASLQIVAAVDDATIQDYAVGDRIAAEIFALAFFTTAGRFDEDRGAATRQQPAVPVELRREAVPDGTTDALLWVVLRDLRGGQAVAGPYRIAVEP